MSGEPSYVTVVAIAHPVGRPNTYNGAELTRDDIKKMTEIINQKEIPTLYEHNNNLMKIGKVIRFHLAKDDQLGIVALLDINTPAGAVIFRMIQNRIFVGLSVSIGWEKNDRGQMIARDILEVSYTRFPRLSGTKVEYVSEMLIASRDSPLQKEYDKLFANIYKCTTVYFQFLNFHFVLLIFV